MTTTIGMAVIIRYNYHNPIIRHNHYNKLCRHNYKLRNFSLAPLTEMWYTCNMNVPKNLTEQALKDAGIEFTDYANYLIEHHGFVRGMLRGRIGSGDVVHSLCAVYRGMEIATCCSVCHSANWQGGLHIADSTTKITCKKCVMPERKRSERQEMIHTLNTVYGYDTGKIGYANTEQVKWLLWQEIIRAKSGD